MGRAMWDVFLALIPVTLVAIYFFQGYALLLVVVCLATAALTELFFRWVMNKKPTLQDGSALLTGLLVALCFSATSAWWRAALATFLAVGIAKELMGGLGWNRFNPALFGRVAVIILAPWFAFLGTEFSPWAVDLGSIDVMTNATPLALLQQGMAMPDYLEMFLAFPGGAMAETSVLALLIGAAYLFIRKHISWRIPVSIIGTVFILTLVFGENPIYHLLSGGLMLGAFFMATDWVTSPITDTGKIAFGILIGILIVVFRVGLAATEGVAFAILIMNAFVPVIEKTTKRLTFSDPLPRAASSSGQQVAK